MIGAAKSGSSSLHHYLGMHPEIFMSDPKELRFFVEERNWHRGLAWYASHFDVGERVRGESSPLYSGYPIFRGVPERIAQVLPEVKLVYVVRDPIERIRAEYVMRVQSGDEPLPLDEAIQPFEGNFYVSRSRYWVQLERYHAHFPRERVLVVDSHDLDRRTAAAMRRVFAFLGVDERFSSPRFEERWNVAYPARRRSRLGEPVVRGLDAVLGQSRSERLRDAAPPWLHAPFSTPVRPPEIESALLVRLRAYLAPDAERLRRETGLAFKTWSV